MEHRRTSRFGGLRAGGVGCSAWNGDALALRSPQQPGIAPDSAGTVNVLRGERRYSVRARLDSAGPDDGPLGPGQSVVVVGMADGIATVVPMDMKLLED